MSEDPLKCVLCCNVTFETTETLKKHLIEVFSRLKCPICNKNSSEFENFIKHLKECRTEDHIEENETEIVTEDISEGEVNDPPDPESAEDKQKVQKNVYYCEICEVYFGEMKKHLREYHMGQQVVLESQNLDKVFEEDTNSDEDSVTKPESEIKVESKETEHIFLEEEISDEDGSFYTKKLIKVAIVPDDKQLPSLAPLSFKNNSKSGASKENKNLPPLTIITKNKTLKDDVSNKNKITHPLLPVTSKVNSKNVVLKEYINLPPLAPLSSKKDTKDIVTEKNNILMYQCKKCGKNFSEFSSYKLHGCSSKRREICDICSIFCQSKEQLSQHMRKCHSESSTIDNSPKCEPNQKVEKKPEKVICEVCKIEFTSKKSMAIHKRIHLPIRIQTQSSTDPPATYNLNGTTVSEETKETFTCKVCNREYNKKYEDVHMESHNKEFLICSFCNRSFAEKDDLALHLQAHGTAVEEKISCKFCKKIFLAGESLEDHVKNHCDERKYCCSFCGRKFSKPHEKVKHERIHTGVKPYVCQICGRSFRVSYCLTLHMRTHNGIRPYKCDICDKRFKGQGAYRHHIQSHSDVRAYKCPFCPKAFKTAVQLAGHKNSHTKPFQCNICNRPFASLYTAKNHMKSHDRANRLDHQCPICGAEYTRHYALKEHIATHSDVDEEEEEELEPPAKKHREQEEEIDSRQKNK